MTSSYERQLKLPLVAGERIEVRLGDRLGTSICGYLHYRTDRCLVITSIDRSGSLYERGSITLTAEKLKGASIRRLEPEGRMNLEQIIDMKED